MSLTYSNMITLGAKAPDFKLPDTISNTDISLDDVKSDKGTVVLFICNHCPYVIHINTELVSIAQDYQAKGISFIAISSNDADNYPQDGPVQMKAHAKHVGYPFPYLYDESQEVAKAYDAACTPDFYVFDGDTKLTYRGRMDESSPGNGKPLTGQDLRQALDALLDGGDPVEKQFPSMGCNIKWKQ